MLTMTIELWLGVLGLLIGLFGIFLARKAEMVLEQIRWKIDALLRISRGPPQI